MKSNSYIRYFFCAIILLFSIALANAQSDSIYQLLRSKHGALPTISNSVKTTFEGTPYEGQVNTQGLPNGKGIYQWFNKENTFYYVYVGDFVNGMRTGYGKQIVSNGDVYEGNFRDNLYKGKGKYTWQNGTYYDGEWLDRKFSGKGKRLYNDGAFYEGEWKNNIRTNGKYTLASGNIYEGQWLDDKRHNGKFTWKNGDVYEGEWVDDVRGGKGKITYSDGAIYIGEWKNDKKNGVGKYIYTNGDMYEGKWLDNLRFFGKYTWKNGSVYEGEWKNDKRHGNGKMTYANGTVENGNWAEGKFMDISASAKSTNITNQGTAAEPNGKTFCNDINTIIDASKNGYKNVRNNKKKNSFGDWEYSTTLTNLGFEKANIKTSKETSFLDNTEFYIFRYRTSKTFKNDEAAAEKFNDETKKIMSKCFANASTKTDNSFGMISTYYEGELYGQKIKISVSVNHFTAKKFSFVDLSIENKSATFNKIED